MKAAHNGTCQACGSVQAISLEGQTALAHHGYTRQDGWFSGSCQGTYAPPMEHGTKVMEAIVKQCDERVADIDEWIEKDSLQLGSVSVRFQAGPIAAVQTKNCWSEADRDAINDMPTHWVEPWANALHGQQCKLRMQRDQLKGLANLLEGLRDNRHGQPVYDRAQVATAEKAEKAQVRADKAAVREAKEAAKRERESARAERESHTTCWLSYDRRKLWQGRVPVTANELRDCRSKHSRAAVEGTRRKGDLVLLTRPNQFQGDDTIKRTPLVVVVSATLIERREEQ